MESFYNHYNNTAKSGAFSTHKNTFRSLVLPDKSFYHMRINRVVMTQLRHEVILE